MENESRQHSTESETGLRRFLNQYIFVGPVGSLSCVVGLLCYALSSSFKSLFGEWNPTKIVLYIIFSSIITAVVFFAPECPKSVVSMLKPHVKFLVLMFSSLYSFFAERSKEGKPDTWSVVSSVAFALTFLCLSRQIKPDFDVGLCGFFLGHVTGQLMKIHLIFILVAASFCYPLVFLESYSESPSRNGGSSDPLDNIRIDPRTSESLGMGQGGSSSTTEPNPQELEMSQPPPPLRKRVGNVSPSSSPPPSTLWIQDDDRRAYSRFDKGGSSSSDPGNKSFEKLPEVAATEPNPQELEMSQAPPPLRRHGGNVSPSSSPPPSTLWTQDDDGRAYSRFDKGGSSSSDPGNKSFEKLTEVAATEPFLSDIQEQESEQESPWSLMLPPLQWLPPPPPPLSQPQQPLLRQWQQQRRMREWLLQLLRLQPQQLPQGQLLLPPAYSSEKKND